jgi:probable HAF family extracellular repeat protein
MRIISGLILACAVLLTPNLARSASTMSSQDIGSLGGSRGEVIMLGLTNPGVIYSYNFTWTAAGGYQVPAIPVPAPVVPPNPSIRAMNNKGAIAGIFTDALPATPWNTFNNGFYWSPTEGFFKLGGDMTPMFLNDNGEVAGEKSFDNSDRHALYWSRTRGLIDLGTLGGQSSTPVGINANGQIAGYSELATQLTHAFLWTPAAGKLKDLGTLGGNSSHAAGLNNAGQVVGYADTVSGQSHATLWDKSKITDLIPASLSSDAVAINSVGHIAGHFWNGSATHSYFWTSSAGAVDLGTLGGATTDARALNDSDLVTGASDSNNGKTQAFLWKSGTGLVDLGSDSEQSSVGRFINATGAVAGDMVNPSGDTKGFYFAAGTRTLINGLPLPDTTAVGITDAGRVGGHSRNVAGYIKAFTWTAAEGMTELATPAGYHSFAVATSSAGHVLGRYGDSTYTQGWFLWSPDTRQVSLLSGSTDPSNGNSIQIVEAFAVNKSGQVTGSAQIQIQPNAPTSGLFVWTVAGGIKGYSNPLSNGILPAAINDAGQVVGYMYVSGYQTHAFSWTVGAGFLDLGTLGGATSTAVAVNKSGQVTGSADTATTSHAFLYSKKMQDLGALSQDYSQGLALNNLGVGVGIGYTSTGEIHPFLRDNKMHDLGTLGGTEAFPAAINDVNEVVGRSYTPTSSDVEAFLWTSAAGMRQLGDTTWSKSEAIGINAGGQVVVNAFPADGSSRVVVFTTR